MMESLIQALMWGVMCAVTMCTFIGTVFAIMCVAAIITAPIRAIKKRLK